MNDLDSVPLGGDGTAGLVVSGGKHHAGTSLVPLHSGDLILSPGDKKCEDKRTRLALIPMSQLVFGKNCRPLDDGEQLEDLAADISTNGRRSPILVTESDETSYFEIVFGHRRVAAMRLAGLDEVLCCIEANRCDPSTRRLWQFAENYHRRNLTPLEEARFFKAAITDLFASRARRMDDQGQSELAKVVNVRPNHISERLLLLHLSRDQQRALESGKMTLKAALKAAKLRRDEKAQKAEPDLEPQSSEETSADVSDCVPFKLLTFVNHRVKLIAEPTSNESLVRMDPLIAALRGWLKKLESHAAKEESPTRTSGMSDGPAVVVN